MKTILAPPAVPVPPSNQVTHQEAQEAAIHLLACICTGTWTRLHRNKSGSSFVVHPYRSPAITYAHNARIHRRRAKIGNGLAASAVIAGVAALFLARAAYMTDFAWMPCIVAASVLVACVIAAAIVLPKAPLEGPVVGIADAWEAALDLAEHSGTVEALTSKLMKVSAETYRLVLQTSGWAPTSQHHEAVAIYTRLAEKMLAFYSDIVKGAEGVPIESEKLRAKVLFKNTFDLATTLGFEPSKPYGEWFEKK